MPRGGQKGILVETSRNSASTRMMATTDGQDWPTKGPGWPTKRARLANSDGPVGQRRGPGWPTATATVRSTRHCCRSTDRRGPPLSGRAAVGCDQAFTEIIPSRAPPSKACLTVAALPHHRRGLGNSPDQTASPHHALVACSRPRRCERVLDAVASCPCPRLPIGGPEVWSPPGHAPVAAASRRSLVATPWPRP
jgi:hypothetical protein